MPQLLLKGLISCLLLFTLESVFSNDNESWKNKVSDEVQLAFETGEEISVLVYLKDQYVFATETGQTKTEKGRKVFQTLYQHAMDSQKQIREYLDQNQQSYRGFYIVNAIFLKAKPSTIEYLARLEEVKSISMNAPVKSAHERISPSVNTERTGVPEWGLQVIGADKVWEMGYNGSGAVVGGQDTGYDWTHPAIQTRYRGYIDEDNAIHDYNWHDSVHEISPLHNDTIVDPSNNPCGLDVAFPCDDQSHGTHTMGTMVGLDGDNVIGVAPGAQWIGVRNMERGWGSPATYLESFEWFLAPTDLNNQNPDPDKAPHVINNSWSCPLIEGCDSTNWQFMDMAINHLREAGIVVVVSAGNNGNYCGSVNAPASMFEGSFAVGATRIVDTIDGQFIDDIAGYSSWGPVIVDHSFRLKPDISAPGSKVRSCIPGNKYGVSSGTSMAGPHVAGAVALIISAAPQWAGQVELIEEFIQMTAELKTREVDCGDLSGMDVPNFVFGYGRINVYEAVQLARLYDSTTDTDLARTSLEAFPNPLKDRLSIRWETDQPAANVKISDMQGRMVLLSTIENGGSLDVSAFSNGYYILKVLLGHQIITKKIIKHSVL